MQRCKKYNFLFNSSFRGSLLSLNLLFILSARLFSNPDSLKALLPGMTSDARMKAMRDISFEYIFHNNDSSIYYAKSALKIANKKEDVAVLKNILGTAYTEKRNYGEALAQYFQAEKLFREISDTSQFVQIMGNIGYVYELQNLGDKARKQYTDALSYCKSEQHNIRKAEIYNHLASLNYSNQETENALGYFRESYEIYRSEKDSFRVMELLNNLGVVNQALGNFKDAQNSYVQLLRYAQKKHEPQTVTIAYFNLASLQDTLGNYTLALSYLDSSRIMGEANQNFEDLIEIYDLYAKIHLKKQEFELAYQYLDKKAAVKDTMLVRNKDKLLIEMAEKYDSEKKENENRLLRSEQAKNKATLIGTGVALVMMLLIGFVLFKGYRDKRKANQLLSLQNFSIAEQKKIIEEKHQEITDSIHYARKIQSAYLPPLPLFYQLFQGGYILFQPKDVVSGDFYWFYGYPKENGKGRIVFLAVADCTGHGVPGALMSVICSNSLNSAVVTDKLQDPGEILNASREIVKKSLKSSLSEGQKDGMDISFVKLDTETRELWFSGANNPLWIYTGNEMEELAPNKQPIGVHPAETPFRVSYKQLKAGDRLFLFSDGFADQFGGPKGKKFKYRPLMNLLMQISVLDAPQQQEKLSSAFLEWKGNLEQVDDVTIMSVLM